MQILRLPAQATIIGILLITSSAAEARIHRSSAAKAEFKRLHPCPSTGAQRGACPGWIIDHVTALACGGADSPSNMQWQTTEDAKAKDRWERIGCKPTTP